MVSMRKGAKRARDHKFALFVARVPTDAQSLTREKRGSKPVALAHEALAETFVVFRGSSRSLRAEPAGTHSCPPPLSGP